MGLGLRDAAGRARSSRRSARAAWARCIAPPTRNSAGDVAIKVLPAAFAQDTERLARFEREAKLLAVAQPPQHRRVYGFESATLPTARPPLPGDGARRRRDLAERLKRGALPLDEALAIARQIAEALEEAHEQRHRPSRPEARQREGHPGRQGQGARLRPRQGLGRDAARPGPADALALPHARRAGRPRPA